ncbi:isoprenyl transferase [Actinoplanes sp. NPDC000266]
MRFNRTTSGPQASATPPRDLPREAVPQHVAVVMDGNGRWAKDRGMPRSKGHAQGEHALMEAIDGAIELGIPYLSAFAFSTENWRRSPDEVRFLMNLNRDVVRRRRDELIDRGVRVVWAGRAGRLWRSVQAELRTAEQMSRHNRTLTLQFCVNYGGQAEIVDAASAIAREVASGKIDAARITEKTFRRYLYHPEVPDVDLFLRPSGELRTSNFLLWQSAYAELIFMDVLWPDFDRHHLRQACELYADRDRRFGGALPNPAALVTNAGARA